MCITARHSQMFDEMIHWTFLDEKYFGQLVSFDDRAELLNEEEKSEPSTIYELKKKQAKENTISTFYHAIDPTKF